MYSEKIEVLFFSDTCDHIRKIVLIFKKSSNVRIKTDT